MRGRENEREREGCKRKENREGYNRRGYERRGRKRAGGRVCVIYRLLILFKRMGSAVVCRNAALI